MTAIYSEPERALPSLEGNALVVHSLFYKPTKDIEPTMKSMITRLAAVSVLALSLASGLRNVRAESQPTQPVPIQHSIQLSGGYFDPDTQTADAVYVSANGQSGVASRTTQAAHDWGFVSNVQYVSATEAIITAPEYGTDNTIVVDAHTDTQSLSFAKYDEDGNLIAGSPDQVHLVGRIVIR